MRARTWARAWARPMPGTSNVVQAAVVADGDDAAVVDAVAADAKVFRRACSSPVVAGWARSHFFRVCWNLSTVPWVSG
jgi:hypothetical protein